MTSYETRIARAETLSRLHSSAAPLLTFYAELARFQARIFADCRSGAGTDPRELLGYFPELVKLASGCGTELLADFAAKCLKTDQACLSLLVTVWEGREAVDPAGRFYARVLLQPFAEYLASRGDISSSSASPTCPFCSARPVSGVLRGEGDGGKRSLVCSLCSTEWQFRRVLCPGCGEENKDKLPIFIASEFPAVRVDACDTCHTYIKSIDLTKDGHAIPAVDEIASVALNIWAEDHDYSKLETNLLGM